MKTYGQVIKYIATQAYHAYMGGSYSPWYDIDFEMVAFIYGESGDQVGSDAVAVFDKMCKDGSYV